MGGMDASNPISVKLDVIPLRTPSNLIGVRCQQTNHP